VQAAASSCCIRSAAGAGAARSRAPARRCPAPEFHPEGDVWLHTHLLLEKLPRAAARDACLGTRCCTTSASRHLSAAQTQGPGRPHPLQRPRRSWRPHLRRDSCPPAFSNEDTAQIVALGKEPHALRRPAGDARVDAESLPAPSQRFDGAWELHRRAMSRSAHATLPFITFACQQCGPTQPRKLRPAPLLTGRDLIAAGYRPSPQFKVMLTARRGRPTPSMRQPPREEALGAGPGAVPTHPAVPKRRHDLGQTTSPIVVYCFHNEIRPNHSDVCILTLALAWPSRSSRPR